MYAIRSYYASGSVNVIGGGGVTVNEASNEGLSQRSVTFQVTVTVPPEQRSGIVTVEELSDI